MDMDTIKRSASTPLLKARRGYDHLPIIDDTCLKDKQHCNALKRTSTKIHASSLKNLQTGIKLAIKASGEVAGNCKDTTTDSSKERQSLSKNRHPSRCQDAAETTLRLTGISAQSSKNQKADIKDALETPGELADKYKDTTKESSKKRPCSVPCGGAWMKRHPSRCPSSARCASIDLESGSEAMLHKGKRSASEGRTIKKQGSAKSEAKQQDCLQIVDFNKQFASTWPRLPSCYFDSIVQRQKQQKLRVAILNVCKRAIPHPGAQSCLVALTRTPWFQSKAAVHFLNVPQPPDKRLSFVSPVHVVVLQASDIRPEILCRPTERDPTGFDVLVVPGGSSKTDLLALGQEGCSAIQEFVRSGGGYCGVCAGAFLGVRHLKLVHANIIGSQSEDIQKTEDGDDDIKEIGTWHHGKQSFELSLRDGEIHYSHNCLSGKLTRESPGSEWLEGRVGNGKMRFKLNSSGEMESNFKPDCKDHWRTTVVSTRKESRAAFNVETHFSKLGRRLLWCEGLPRRAEEEEAKDGAIVMRYHNGPLMEIPKGSHACALCHMSSPKNVATNAPPEITGAVAILMQDYGGGRAIMVSPHPESTHESGFESEPGKVRLRRVLQRAVLLAAAGPSAYSWIAEALECSDRK